MKVVFETLRPFNRIVSVFDASLSSSSSFSVARPVIVTSKCLPPLVVELSFS